jgi:hypothetical protein
MVKFALLLSSYAIPADVCFDNEGGGGAGNGTGEGGDTAAAAAATAAAAAAAAAASKTKAFSQEDINTLLAEDRRKHAAKLKALEETLQGTLKTSQMTQQQRDELEVSMEDMRKQFLSKEQQALMEKQTIESNYKKELEAEKAARKAFETKFVDSTISRSLADAAIDNGAFSADQIVALLRPHTKLINDVPVVDFNDKHAETGEPIITQMSPAAAVKRMKELAEVHGNLFKSNVVSGVGGSSGTANPGKIDMRKLTPQQYAKLRRENPSALGF